jgi:hypothetical protein
MKHVKQLALAAIGALVLMALLGSANVSATTLSKINQIPNEPFKAGTEIAASLKSESSLILKDKNTTTNDTCTGSELKAKTEAAGATVTAPISTLAFTGCSHTTHAIKAGTLHFAWSSATNGTVTLSGTEWTIKSTVFGVSAICKAGEGSPLGTLTGAKSSSEHATLDIEAQINCGALGSSTLTGTYSVTSPTGLGVEGS